MIKTIRKIVLMTTAYYIDTKNERPKITSIGNIKKKLFPNLACCTIKAVIRYEHIQAEDKHFIFNDCGHE